jgi:hypothetical protein
MKRPGVASRNDIKGLLSESPHVDISGINLEDPNESSGENVRILKQLD